MRLLVRSICALAFVLVRLAAQGPPPDQKYFDQVFGAMRLSAGAVVADVGTGPAPWNPLHMAKIVGPSGRVLCVDIDQEALDKLAEALKPEGLTNIGTHLGKPDDPVLPDHSCDAVLIANAYHHLRKPAAMLDHIRRALKPEGRLVIVERIRERDRGVPRSEQVSRHQFVPELLESELKAAGFQVVTYIDLGMVGDGLDRYLVAATPRRE